MKTMKRIFYISLLICLVSFKAKAQTEVSFFVQADEDDWQLYMCKQVTGDLAAGGKVIMITLTAGDEGYGTGTFNGSTTPYYQARERGAVYASKAVSDFSYTAYYPFSYQVPTSQNVLINGKNLVKYTYGDPSGAGQIVNYFLRLPDGGPTGSGYPATSNVSLMKLKQGIITNITSIDGANTYTWNDLVNTILSIMLTERGSDPQFYLHTSSLDGVANPGDHSDHIYSSTAAQEAVAPHLAIGINEFIFDYSSSLANNLGNEDYENAAGALSAYGWSLILDKYPSPFNSTNRAWLPQEYATIKRTPQGALPVTLLEFKGALQNKKVLLEWSTSAEYNSKQFEIEKSLDGFNYKLLHTTPAAGNSTSEKNYSYIDANVADINYYRLKMLDIDGGSKQSNVVVIKNKILQQSIVYTTNPFNNKINVRFAKIPQGDITVSLINMNGKQVFTKIISNPQSRLVEIETGNTQLSKAMYILRIESEGQLYNVKLLKE